jgi:hypothetical protein
VVGGGSIAPLARLEAPWPSTPCAAALEESSVDSLIAPVEHVLINEVDRWAQLTALPAPETDQRATNRR